MNVNGKYVWVRRQYNCYYVAKYHLKDFAMPQWENISGGVKIKSPRYFINGYVRCDSMIEGELKHTGEHMGLYGMGCPHSIQVCALKKDNEKDVYEYLKTVAGEYPETRTRPKTGNTCKKDILNLLTKNHSLDSTELFSKLEEYGHRPNNINIVLKKLAKNRIIEIGKSCKDRRKNLYYLIQK